MATRRIIILGSTGSIGTQTLAVIEHLNTLYEQNQHPDKYVVVALAGGSNADALASQANALGVRQLSIASQQPDHDPRWPSDAFVRSGKDAAEQLVRELECDLVVCAMVGIAGLAPTLAAIELGHNVALANKETLVAAGELIIAAAQKSGSRILPIDSEHAAAWQLMQSLDSGYTPPSPAPVGVARLTLTASGGPFRDMPAHRLGSVTPQQALQHPTWSMGPKNTIDSATMMNKALELIEARWLFDLSPDKLDAIIQPTSLIHALLETTDGSVLAQLSKPDMRLPIQQAITWPTRAARCVDPLDLRSLNELRFQPIDEQRSGAIALAREAMTLGGTAGAIINAANEIAVQAFLDSRLAFLDITEITARALQEIPVCPAGSLAELLDADAQARQWASSAIAHPASL